MDKNDEIIGIIRSAIVFGRSEKHYDILFYKDRIEIVYLGEYRFSRMKQMFNRATDALIYKILRDKQRNGKRSNVILIRANEISSIRIRYIPVKNAKIKTNYLLLEINTVKGRYEFYVSAKIIKAVRSIINKFYKEVREK